jgi:myo-inositol catabolism protein IolS
MKYRRLGKTDLNVSVVGVGTWQFGGEWGQDFTQAEVDAILGSAKDRGINLLDTAECYGDHLSESFIGKSIKGQRSDWIVATKFGHKFHGRFDRTDHGTAQEVLQQLEASLKALQTDYVDLYQAHGDQYTNDEELWQMLNDQVKAGKIRHLGISISNNTSADVTNTATQLNAQTIQVVYNRLDKNPEAAVYPACIEQDLGVLARVPLASGYLSGKYKPGTTFTDEKDVRHRHQPADVERKLQEVADIQRNEVPEGVPMAGWALAWCLQHAAVTCVIPGMKNIEQVEKNAAAADLAIVRDDHPQAVS